jgi:hypothetical protein
MSDNSWCRDIPRDEAVRAAEDGRSGPLPTLEECIERQKHAAMTAGVKEGFVKADGEWKRLTDDELRQILMIPKTVSASSAVEPENKGNGMRPPTTKTATVENDFADGPKCSTAVSESGKGQSGMRTERVMLEITHDLDAPLGDWIVQVLDESLGYDETVRVVEEAKLAPAANADGGSNHAAPAASVNSQGILDSSPAASGAAGTEPDAWGVRRKGGVDAVIYRLFRSSAEASAEQYGGIVVPLYAAPQPAPGWLTAEEREALAFAAKKLYELSNRQYVNGDQDAARDTVREEGFLQSLLARSSPPEVVLPVSTIGRGERYDGDWVEGWIACRERCAAALDAAGVKVKEVGRE